MSKANLTLVTRVAFVLLSTTAGCASSQVDSSVDGPQISNARAAPGTIIVNKCFQPTDSHQFLADVQDSQGAVTDVRMRFVSVPIEVPMERVDGTTWRGALSPDQIKRLAVSGHKIGYEAKVVAKDDQGRVTESPDTVEIQVKAPGLSDDSG